MRVLGLVSDGFGAAGGIARYNSDLFFALVQTPFIERVDVLPRFGDGSVALPTRVAQKQAQASRALWVAGAAAYVLREKPEVVFCGHLNFVLLAEALARASHAKLWLQLHGIEAWPEASALVRKCVGRACLITAVSRYTRARFLAWSDVAPEYVRILPNTYRSEFAPRPRRQDLVSRLGLAGKRVIVTVGRMASAERYKGVDRVIRALPVVVRRCPDAIYLVVGSGDDERRLRELACERDVVDRVLFAGQVPANELNDYLALGDVFVMPSTGEGFGIVFLEAAASGLLVIGGDRDGSRDALADGAIGRMIDPLSETELIEALVTTLNARPPIDYDAIRRFEFTNFTRHVSDIVKHHLSN